MIHLNHALQIFSSSLFQCHWTINTQIQDIEQVISREAVIRKVSVEYLLPGVATNPDEYQNLKARKFEVGPLISEPAKNKLKE
jgi:hypothetical protein